MKFTVTKNKVSLIETEGLNEGEYKATRCQFEFDDIYAGLVKKAMFTNLFKGGSYEVSIIDNSCDIPAEVLQSKGNIKVGVYAYEVDNEELKLRYSPTPVHIKIDLGSYISNPLNPEEITPTQFEQYMQAMNDGLAEVENVDIDAVKEGDTATITITNRDGETKSVEIKDGAGGGGGGGTYNFNELTNRPKYADTTMTGSTNIPKVPTKTSDLTNNSDYQTGSQVQSAISSATAGKQDTLTAGNNISITNNTISATDTTYTAGNGLDLTGTVFSVDTSEIATKSDLSGKQDTLTAGSNITITDNTISATDTTYSEFTGTDGTSAGTSGLVPAPTTTDVDKFLKSDGTWSEVSGGGSSVTVVQTTGTSMTDVMSQDAITKMTYPRYGFYNDAIAIRGAGEVPDSSAGFMSTGFGASHYARGGNSVAVGYGATVYASGEYSIAIGNGSKANNNTRALAIGNGAEAANNNSVAIGTNAKTTRVGEMNVGAGTSGRGYNNTNYRVIGGVHNPVDDHDAATKGYVDNVTSYITNATEYSTSATYAIGDYVIYNGGIYQCNTTIVGGEAWNASHWDAVDSLQEQLDNTETWTFTLADNSTVTKKVVVR